MERTQKNILILCCSLATICAVTYCAGVIKYIDDLALKIMLKVLLNILNGVIAFVAMKQMKMSITIDLKNKRQYIIGVSIAVALSVAIAVIPALCGISLIGGHMDFSWFAIIYDFLFYMLIIELIVYYFVIHYLIFLFFILIH